jgi:hypothetical protein
MTSPVREQQIATGIMELRDQRNYAAAQTDMYYTEFHWELNPSVYYIKGEITYYFKSKVDNLKQLVLDLDTTMHIHFIRRGTTDLDYVHSDDLLLTIDLDKTLQPGESDTLTISYEGVPHSTVSDRLNRMNTMATRYYGLNLCLMVCGIGGHPNKT